MKHLFRSCCKQRLRVVLKESFSENLGKLKARMLQLYEKGKPVHVFFMEFT